MHSYPMVNRIASLERELERIERELERKDAILLNIGEAMKDISSPTEQPGRVVPHEQPLEGAQEEPVQESAQKPAEELTQELTPVPAEEPPQERRSSWWSRIFGG